MLRRFGGDPLARLLQHLRRQVDADDLQMPPIGRQRQAGADAHLEHAALALVDDLDRVLAPLGGDEPEGVVVDRSPAAIGALDGVLVHLADATIGHP